MKPIEVVSLVVLVLLAIFLIGFFVVLPMMGRSLAECEDRTVQVSPSPHGNIQAVVHTRNCGGGTSTPGSTNVSLLPPETAPTGFGNVMSVRTLRACPEDSPDVNVRWDAETMKLWVYYHSSATVTFNADEVHGYSIAYRHCDSQTSGYFGPGWER